MNHRTLYVLVVGMGLLVLPVSARAQNAEQKAAAKKKAEPPPLPERTLADVAYGSHPKQVLDFWKAESAEPAPLLFFIHGGGWQGAIGPVVCRHCCP